MNETQMNGTHVKETLDDGAMADGMPTDGGGGDGWDVEKARRVRLRGFLRELVREEGRVEAAELLGVAYRTVVRAEESGEITGRMGDALERLLNTGEDPEVVRLRERVDALEDQLAALASGGETPGADAEGEGASGRVDTGNKDEVNTQAQKKEDDTGTRAKDGKDGEGAGRSATGAAPQVVRLRPVNPDTLQPFDPEIVTVEPADDDVDIYGAAWPLVEEWRKLRDGHPNQGRSLSWLTTRERLLVLELGMLEVHGLTLPPEKQPLRGFGRSGQTNWRRMALGDTRKALARRQLLRWVRRILTCGLWWK